MVASPAAGNLAAHVGRADQPGEPERPPPAGTLRIGRAPDNDIVVSDPGVSRHHAELRYVAGAYRIVDLDSANGTFVNGQRVTAAPLSEGDLVGVGSATFRLAGQELREIAEPGVPAGQAPPPAAGRRPGAADGDGAGDGDGRWRSRTRFAGWCRRASGSRTSTS